MFITGLWFYIRSVKRLRNVVLLMVATAMSLGKPLSAQTSYQGNSAAATPGPIEVVGCVNRKDGRFELTNAVWYVVYYLSGKVAGLENHIGDEVTLRGTEREADASHGENQQAKTLDVTSVHIMTHKNPEGVRPVLGGPGTWANHLDKEYGLRLRYPPTFVPNAKWGYSTIQSNFPGEAQPPAVEIVTAQIPQTVYPDSNFVDGGFAVFVDPKIHTEGTCRQFGRMWPEHTAPQTIGGAVYARTLEVGVAAGTSAAIHSFHTFQHGVCYEFAFGFAEEDGAGLDVPCSVQWVSEENEFELMERVLKTVSFLRATPAPAARRNERTPSISLFDHSPAQFDGTSTKIDVSWKASDADYVQLRYACIANLYASIVKSSTGNRYGLACDRVESNLPPAGSLTLLLNNFSPRPVDLILTIEPYVAGVGAPKQTKSITISVDPHPAIKPQAPKPAYSH